MITEQILHFAFPNKFPTIHSEPNYINKDNNHNYYFINLNKLFWRDLYALKLYKNIHGLKKIVIAGISTFLQIFIIGFINNRLLKIFSHVIIAL